MELLFCHHYYLTPLPTQISTFIADKISKLNRTTENTGTVMAQYLFHNLFPKTWTCRQPNQAGSLPGGQLNTLTWDDFPQQVQCKILTYLDRRTCNILRQISASARHLIENVYGIHVHLPLMYRITPKRPSYAAYAGQQNFPVYLGIEYVITKELFNHCVTQMEGKKIHTLEMFEQPPDFEHFPFARFIRYPKSLVRVKLQFVDIVMLDNILTYCSRLHSFDYETGYRCPIPSFENNVLGQDLYPYTYIYAWESFSRFLTKVRSFQPNLYHQLSHLKEMSLTISRMNFYYGSDFGNVAYLLLCLPALPTLTKFRFSLNPSSKLGSKTLLLLLSCLAEFLWRTPTLQEFILQSLTDLYRPTCLDNPDGVNMMQVLIREFGSQGLVEVAQESEAPFGRRLVALIRERFLIAAQNLGQLRLLDVQTNGDDSENDVLASFVTHLPDGVPLTSCRITDNMWQSSNTQAAEEGKSKLYKLFALLHDGPPPLYGYVAPVYQSLTRLTVNCNFLAETTLSLNRIMNNIPRLTDLTIWHVSYSKWYWNVPDHVYFHFEENLVDSPFARLKTLSLANMIIDENRFPAISLDDLLRQCKNLEKLELRYKIQRWSPDSAYKGIHVSDLLRMITGLRRLRQVHLDKVYFNLLPSFWIYYKLDPTDQVKKTVLEDMGATLINLKLPENSRIAYMLGMVARDEFVAYYDFSFLMKKGM